MRPLLEKIQNGEIDPSFVVTHRLSLEDAPRGYEMFLNKQDGCTKIVLKPNGYVDNTVDETPFPGGDG
jgi:threonine dehydrogenase-like Zn-dependent dehydrogenase